MESGHGCHNQNLGVFGHLIQRYFAKTNTDGSPRPGLSETMGYGTRPLKSGIGTAWMGPPEQHSGACSRQTDRKKEIKKESMLANTLPYQRSSKQKAHS